MTAASASRSRSASRAAASRVAVLRPAAVSDAHARRALDLPGRSRCARRQRSGERLQRVRAWLSAAAATRVRRRHRESTALVVGRARRAQRAAARRALAGPDALVQPQQPEPGDLVCGLSQDAQRGQEVLDVRGLEELQAAVLHERDPAGGQLDLEQVAVVRRPASARRGRAAGRRPRPPASTASATCRASSRRVVAAHQPGLPAAADRWPVARAACRPAARRRHRAGPRWPARAAAGGTGSCARAGPCARRGSDAARSSRWPLVAPRKP